MILDCEYCYNRIVIRPDDREAKVNFCPVCGEPTKGDDERDELDFNYYEDE